jgi:hypothetical protein
MNRRLLRKQLLIQQLLKLIILKQYLKKEQLKKEQAIEQLKKQQAIEQLKKQQAIYNYNLKDKYNSIIPLKVYQTWHTHDLPNHMKKVIEHNKKINPEFEFIIYDDNDCREFIIKYFDFDIIQAYDSLKPGAYKADLWRYCMLYIKGGIYMDIKFICVNGFKLITLTENEFFPTDVVISEYPNNEHKAVYNGFMVSLPGNKYLLNAIHKVVENVKNKYYGISPLDPTGPIMFGHFFDYEKKKNAVVRRYVGNKGNGLSIHGTVILDEYKKYREEQKSNGKPHYNIIWRNKDIYEINIMDQSNICFVTAFKDIGRNNWKTHKRTMDEYLQYFYKMAKNMKYNLIVYVDDNIKEKILKELGNNYKNIIIENINNVETFLQTYLDKEREIIDSVEFKSKLPSNRLGFHPETYIPEYNLINHSKINFICHTKKNFPNYHFYSWIDFGYVRNVNDIPKNISKNIDEKIIYQNLNNIPNERIDENEVLKIDKTYICGSTFLVHHSLVETFKRLYEEKIKQWQKNYISDDDQSLVLQIYYENKDLFKLFYNNDWFQLYKHLFVNISFSP